jgi:hypothetical protein
VPDLHTIHFLSSGALSTAHAVVMTNKGRDKNINLCTESAGFYSGVMYVEPRRPIQRD